MHQMQVLFDRADRLFRFGDEVTGRVVTVAGSDLRCRKVRISYSWRTHGKGDRDKGGADKLMLAEEVFLTKGERQDFSFRFKVPVGPVTYHGHHLNVDWYVTASAAYGLGATLKCEEDFLLLAGEPAGAIVIGNREISLNELPPWPPQGSQLHEGGQEGNVVGPAPKRQGLMAIILSFFSLCVTGTLFAYLYLYDRPGAAWGFGITTLLLASAVIASIAIILNAYRGRLKMGAVWVSPGILYAGSQVKCHLDFRTKQEVYIHKIEAQLTAAERVSYTRGTASVVERHIVSKTSSVKIFNEQLSGGRQISFECLLPVQADAPATFESPFNALEWAVDLSVDLGRWPGLTRHIPITVLSGGSAPPIA